MKHLSFNNNKNLLVSSRSHSVDVNGSIISTVMALDNDFLNLCKKLTLALNKNDSMNNSSNKNKNDFNIYTYYVYGQG